MAYHASNGSVISTSSPSRWVPGQWRTPGAVMLPRHSWYSMFSGSQLSARKAPPLSSTVGAVSVLPSLKPQPSVSRVSPPQQTSRAQSIS